MTTYSPSWPTPYEATLPLPPREHGLASVPLHPEVGAGMGHRMDPDRLADVVDDQRSPGVTKRYPGAGTPSDPVTLISGALRSGRVR